MSNSERSILDAALALPPASRALLADSLWASLPDDEVPVECDEATRRAWLDEARRRMCEVETGATHLVPGEEVMARLAARMQQ